MIVDFKIVASVFVPIFCVFLGTLLNRFFEKKAKLTAYLGHVASFKVKGNENPFFVNTHSLVILNAGKLTANNVRISHYNLPDFNILPSHLHSVEPLNENEKDIVISKLVPGEQITISYLYMPPLTVTQVISGIKSDEGFAKILTVLPTQQFPKWVNLLILILMCFGLISILYFLVILIKCLYVWFW